METVPLTHPLACFLALAAMVGASACTPPGESPSQTRGTEAEETPLVRVVQPQQRDLDHVLEITAEVVPVVESQVGARLQGIPVVEVLKEVGDGARAGETLVRLESAELIQAVEEAQLAHAETGVRIREAEWAIKELEAELRGRGGSVERKTRAFERARQQAERGAVAQEDLEAARYDLDQEMAQEERLRLQIEKAKVAKELAENAREKAALALARARLELEYAEVKAPLDGIISERMTSPGQMTSMGQPLFRIFDPRSIVVETHIPQRDLLHVTAGLEVRFRTDAFRDLVFHGSVSLVAPVVDEVGTVMVRLQVDAERTLQDPDNHLALNDGDSTGLRLLLESGQLLKPGLFVSGRIILETRRAVLTVPRKAVGYQRGQPFLFVVARDAGPDHAGTVRRHFFTEGLGEEGIVEVMASAESNRLSPDSLVVLVGQDRLRDGDTVRLQVDDPGTAGSGK